MTNYFEVDKVITCSGTAPVASTAVDIYAIKEGKEPLLMKRQLAVTAGAWTTTMTVPSSYVSPFGEVYLKVVDSYNPTIAGTKFYTIDPTLTITTPVLTGGASGTVSGTSNHVGQKVEVELRLAGQDPEDSWTPFGQATVAENGTWAATNAAPAAGTYDFRVIDENIDPAICSAQVDDVVVASGQYIIDNFESYAVGSNPVGQGWTKEAGTPNASIVELDGTNQVWKIKWDTVYNHNFFKTVTATNFKNKTLKITLKGTQYNKAGIRVALMYNTNQVEYFSTFYAAPTSWTTKTYNITYDGLINIIRLDVYAENNIYFDDIIIE